MIVSRLSLLWKILISTSVGLTLLFGATAYIVQRNVVQTTTRNLQDEVRASFRAYESLWKARADYIAGVTEVLANMSDVRAAFSTGDQATIRDTAGELWSRVSTQQAFFVVTDPRGRVIASLGEQAGTLARGNLAVVRSALPQFPAQATGFAEQNNELFQIVVTPVYVESGGRPALLNVLVAGYKVDDLVAESLKQSTGGSEFLFTAHGRIVTSTLSSAATAALSGKLFASNNPSPQLSAAGIQYSPLVSPLLDLEGKQIGKLWILRSFESAQQRLTALQHQMTSIWLGALFVALLLTYFLAKKIVNPIVKLDRAASEVARQNYGYRVDVEGDDELGRLARTFNDMCGSIQQAREELIRQERISTIGRLSTSIVHDLRSPLAAIYGGAEMLVDSRLSSEQVSRLARNIYRASRQIQELLQDLINVSRGKATSAELCNLHEVIEAAWDLVSTLAERQNVRLDLQTPEAIEIPMERARMERAFLNLIENALEAMPDGGVIRIRATTSGEAIVVSVEDTGPGINPGIRDQLFQPFVTAGKKNGLGLGLALSRQTLLDNGGDLWIDVNSTAGARFCLRLPLSREEVDVGTRV
jgi:signal transduction histidine kinase